MLNEEKTEELLWSFGVASVGELIELLLRLDALLAARGGRGLGKLLGSLADQLMNGTDLGRSEAGAEERTVDTERYTDAIRFAACVMTSDGLGDAGAPADASPRGGDCKRRVAKGGAWYYEAEFARPSARMNFPKGSRLNVIGLRVARRWRSRRAQDD